MNNNDNKFIENYLLQYSLYKGSIEYAILIKGEWGSGKTFFIKNFMENNKRDIKFVYVSLFGLKTIDEVNEKIFEAFHPILSSKHMKFFSSVAQGAIKFGLKVDLENMISLNKTLSNELNKYIDFDIDENKFIKNFWKLFTKGKNFKKSQSKIVFIFDDLERCLIETKHLFSLINDFVEQKGLKVIIIANEKEIQDINYSKFKEKVIGKEFEINMNFENAYFSFLDMLEDEKIKNIFQNNYLLIREIFNKLEINNLRVLHQTFIEFELFLNNIDSKYLKNDEFVESLILHFFSFVMFFKKTNTIEEIKKIENSFYKDDDNSKSIFQKKLQISLFGVLFGVSFWKDFLLKGYIDRQILNNYIQNTEFFRKEKRPLWVKLWYFRELEDEEFDKLLSELNNKFFKCDKEFENFYVLFHVVGMIIYFMRKGIINITEEQIENQVRKCIDQFKNSDFWKKRKTLSWGNPTGLGYFSENDKFFKKMKKMIDDAIEQAKKSKEEEQKRQDVLNFINAISKGEKDIYKILEKYEYESFFNLFTLNDIQKLLQQTSKSLFLLSEIISYRYSDNYILNGQPIYCSYIVEADFIKNLQESVNRKLKDERVKKLTMLALEDLSKLSKDAIKKLKKCGNETT